jgi:hypothetical protein
MIEKKFDKYLQEAKDVYVNDWGRVIVSPGDKAAALLRYTILLPETCGNCRFGRPGSDFYSREFIECENSSNLARLKKLGIELPDTVNRHMHGDEVSLGVSENGRCPEWQKGNLRKK